MAKMLDIQLYVHDICTNNRGNGTQFTAFNLVSTFIKHIS